MPELNPTMKRTFAGESSISVAGGFFILVGLLISSIFCFFSFKLLGLVLGIVQIFIIYIVCRLAVKKVVFQDELINVYTFIGSYSVIYQNIYKIELVYSSEGMTWMCRIRYKQKRNKKLIFVANEKEFYEIADFIHSKGVRFKYAILK